MITFTRIAIGTVLMAALYHTSFGQTLSYSSNNFNAVQNTAILTINPTVTGGSFQSFKITPTLPTGLTFATTTGTISGIPSTAGKANYTVTGINGANNSSFVIGINVAPAMPAFRYSTNSYTFTAGIVIPELIPVQTGGAGIFSVNRTLPAGLSLDQATGVLSGKSTGISPATIYTVICKNETGVNTFTFTLQVQAEAPSITYSPAVYEFVTDAKIKPMRPTNNDTLFSQYSVSPELPRGLHLNSATGEISGTPVEAINPGTYTVTATSVVTAAAASQFKLNITIAPKPDFVTIPSTIRFVGEGNIQQSISNGSKIPASTGIGVIYREYSRARFKWLHNIEAELSINIASTVDTIKSINNAATNEVTNKGDFGTSVLLPINSGQAFSFRLTGYLTDKGGAAGNWRRNLPPRPLWRVISGFKVAAVSSNRNWQYVSNDETTTLVKASMLNVYAGLFYEFITPKEENNYGQNASITFGMGYSGRWILGDAQQDPQGALREKLLGSERKTFNGMEINFGLRFYNIKAEVRLPLLSRKDNIPGLSGVQPNYFIGFSGGFPIDLTKKADQ